MEGGIHRLPDEILSGIFSHLSVDELGRASYVCRRWRGILKSHTSLWKGHRVFYNNRDDIREVLLVANAMPPLETLQFSFAKSFSAKIAWPDLSVTIPQSWEMRHAVFVAKNYVIKYSSLNDIFSYLSWVQLKTLKRLHLGIVSCISASVILSTLMGNLLSARARLLYLKLDTERELETLQEYFCSLSRVTSATRRGESWNSSLEAALAIANREASHDSEDAAENDSSSQLALCPALEELSVSVQIDRIDLETLCLLGPVRLLRLEWCTVSRLSFLPHCASRLEELLIGDCSSLQETELVHLSCLKMLRVLKLSNCRFSSSVVRTYTDCLPHLVYLEVVCH